MNVSLDATVSSPFEPILVPDVTTPVPDWLELTSHVTVVTGSLVPVTEAENCRVPPALTLPFTGAIVTLVIVGTTIETEALPDLDGSTTEVAVMKRVLNVSLADTVSNPLVLILVPVAT